MRDILDHLMAGEFICSISQKIMMYKLHEDALLRERVDNALRPFGAKLESIGEQGMDPEGYYASYLDLSHKSDVRNLKEQFYEMRDEIRPVVEFIAIYMKTLGTDFPIEKGQVIKQSDIWAAVAEKEALAAELKGLAANKFYGRHRAASDLGVNLKNLLEGLKEKGYLVCSNREMAIYEATVKFDYFYEVLQFIAEHEEIELIDDNAEQQENLF